MKEETIDTHSKALKINLDPRWYGTFAEIGAGQEVVRWFFRVGGAAGTIAKSISAYDMRVSDAIDGHGRFHCAYLLRGGCRLVTAASSSRGPRPAKRSNLSPGNRGCQGQRPREAGLLREEPAALGACLVQEFEGMLYAIVVYALLVGHFLLFQRSQLQHRG